MGSIQVALVLFDLDGHSCDVVIELAVSRDLSGKTPVSGVGHSVLQDLEVAPRTGEHVSEPHR
jgi:hypothetical protein